MSGLRLDDAGPGGRRLMADEGGNISVLTALLLPVLMMLCAIAIDTASLFVERREAQSITDLAAITAVNNTASAANLARSVFEDNGVVAHGYAWPGSLSESAESLSVETGRYDASISIASANRFVAGGLPANAVRVRFKKPGDIYFARMFTVAPTIGTSAVAYSNGEATFTVGSRLASVSGGAANAVLSGLLGTSLSLSVADYNSLIGLDVNFLAMLDALAGELELEAGTYNEVLSTNVTLGDIASAMMSVAPAQSTAALALSSITTSLSGTTKAVRLNEVVGLGDMGNLALNSPGDIEVSAMEMMTASAVAANGTSQVATSLGVNAGGLATVTTNAAIGEPLQPGLTIATRKTDIVRTAQVRLKLSTQVGGKGLLNLVTVTLPLYLELAYAEASVNSVSCGPGGVPIGASLLVKPALARLWIGTPVAGAMTTFTGAASVGFAPVASVQLLPSLPFLPPPPAITVSAKSFVEAGGGQQTVNFTAAQIAAGTVQTVQTGSPIASISTSLANNLQLQLSGLGLSLDLVKPALALTITTVAPALDTVIDQLLGTLGVGLGEADVRILDINCQRAVLVQ